MIFCLSFIIDFILLLLGRFYLDPILLKISYFPAHPVNPWDASTLKNFEEVHHLPNFWWLKYFF